MIAEELEADIDEIERICNVAADFAPAYDCRKIYDAIHV